MEYSVIVVGAGISGLATAWDLTKSEAATGGVLVLEKATRPGGTSWTENIDGYSLELGPNGFLDNKPSTLTLCNGLGLKDLLVRADPSASRRYLFLGDKLRELPSSPVKFLGSDLLSWKGKLRVLWERCVRKAKPGGDESIYEFGCRRIGTEATEVLLDAFVTGILAGDPKLLSLPACFPRMVELEQEFGSLIHAQGKLAQRRRKQADKSPAPTGAPAGTLTVTRGGMRVLIERLTGKLAPNVHFECPVVSARHDSGRWLVACDDGREHSAEALVLACPAFAQSRILRSIDHELADEIDAIVYTRAVVVGLGYRTEDLPGPVEGFGYLTPQRLGRPVLGMLWNSSFFPDQAPDGRFLFRAILGGWQRKDVLEWSDEALVAAACDDLKQSLNITAQPELTWIHRWPRAIPQYHLGHLDRLKRIDERLTRHRRLYLTGNAYRGVSLNDCTHQAMLTADRVANELKD